MLFLLHKYKYYLLICILALLYTCKFYNFNFIIQNDALWNIYFHDTYNVFLDGWDPYVNGYARWYPVSAIFFPSFAILHFFFTSSITETIYALMVHGFLLLLLIYWSYYYLFSFLKFSPIACLGAATICTFSGFLIQSGLREMNQYYLISYLGIPWIFIFLCKAHRDRSIFYAINSGLVIGLSLLGGTNMPLFFVLPIFSLLIFETELTGRKVSQINSLYFFWYYFISAFVGLMLCAIVYLPAWKWLPLTSRSKSIATDTINMIYDSLGFSELLLLPDSAIQNSLQTYHFIPLGLAVLILALMGCFRQKSHLAGKFTFSLIGIIAIIVLFADRFSFFIPLLKAYFSITSLRHNNRFTILFVMSVAYFVAIGIDSLGKAKKIEHSLADETEIINPTLAADSVIALAKLTLMILILYFLGENGASIAEKGNHSLLFYGLKGSFIVLCLYGLFTLCLSFFNFFTQIQSFLLKLGILLLCLFFSLNFTRNFAQYEYDYTINTYGVFCSSVLFLLFLYAAKSTKTIFTLAIVASVYAYFWFVNPNLPFYFKDYPYTLEQQIRVLYTLPAEHFSQLKQLDSSAFRLLNPGPFSRNNYWTSVAKIEIALEPNKETNILLYYQNYIDQIIQNTDLNRPPLTDFDSPLIDLINAKYVFSEQELTGKYQKTSLGKIYQNTQGKERLFITPCLVKMKDDVQIYAALKNPQTQHDCTFVTQADQLEYSLQNVAKIPYDFYQKLLANTELASFTVQLNEAAYLNYSMPYFPEFRAIVDEEIVIPPLRSYGALTSFPIEPGQHTIKIMLSDSSYFIGKLITLFALLIIVLNNGIYWLKLRQKKSKAFTG